MSTTVSSILRLPLLIGLLLFSAASGGHAQVPRGKKQGTATIEEWPRSLPQLLDEMGRRAPYLLPRIDSLALDYRYAVTDSTSQWSFVLGWRPAKRVLYEGEVLPWRERPRNIRMTNVEFRTDVWVDGEKVAEMIIGVDSMALGPFPDRFAFNVTVAHDRVFLNTSPDDARRILSKDISLEPLIVERMGFTAAGTQRRSPSRPDARRRQDAPPRTPSVYVPRTHVHLEWWIEPWLDPIGVGEERDESRAERPRGATIGQPTDGDANRRRGGDRKGNTEETSNKEGNDEQRSPLEKLLGDDEKEEDEDDTDLRTPALAAAVAVGVVAFAGGTVGIYGRGDTPIGLVSGYTHPRGGVQVQAAVNSAVLEGEPGQKLSLKALGFYDIFTSRLQPAVGLGAQIDPGGGNDIVPTVSGGLVGNFGQLVLYGGFDVVQQIPEVGVAYNFRYDGPPDNAD